MVVALEVGFWVDVAHGVEDLVGDVTYSDVGLGLGVAEFGDVLDEAGSVIDEESSDQVEFAPVEVIRLEEGALGFGG